MLVTKSLGSTFNEVADLYDSIRPGYPTETLDAIASSMGSAASKILEIGCGTGQITRPLADHGYSITALEPGDALSMLARRKLRSYPNVEIVETSFEAWPEQQASFDLVVSAQAFHWIEPNYGCAKAAALLKPGGAIALVWNLAVPQDTELHQAIRPLYKAYFPKSPTDVRNIALVDKAQKCKAALSRCHGFADMREYRHVWDKVYTRENYLKLLHTYSTHRTLPEPSKSDFFKAITHEIEQAGGLIHQKYETLLLIAHKTSDEIAPIHLTHC